jgi:rhodanese-related sulfurtransferase
MVMNFRPVALLFFLVSCATLSDPGEPDWDQARFGQALARGAVLVDLRTPAEAASGALPGAVLVDYWSPEFGRFLEDADRSQTYLVYCAHGIRGREAVKRMRVAGFIDVHNLAGGLVGWKELP